MAPRYFHKKTDCWRKIEPKEIPSCLYLPKTWNLSDSPFIFGTNIKLKQNRGKLKHKDNIEIDFLFCGSMVAKSIGKILCRVSPIKGGSMQYSWVLHVTETRLISGHVGGHVDLLAQGHFTFNIYISHFITQFHF